MVDLSLTIALVAFILTCVAQAYSLSSYFSFLYNKNKSKYSYLGRPELFSANTFKTFSTMWTSLKLIFIGKGDSSLESKFLLKIRISFLLQVSALLLLIYSAG